MTAAGRAHILPAQANEPRRDEMSGKARRSSGGDLAWIIPFYVIILSAIVFFFWQMAQYNLLGH
jgi:hypothetical protein